MPFKFLSLVGFSLATPTFFFSKFPINFLYYCSMKKLLLILLCLPFIGFGQGWEKTYDNSWGYSVQQTSDGGYIVGLTLGNSANIALMKTDSQGDSIWTQEYTFLSDEAELVKVELTLDGGYILCGTQYNYNPFVKNGVMIKTDVNGNQQWYKTFIDVETARSIKQTSDGGYIITGDIRTQQGDLDVWLAKTDSQGNLLWNNNFGGNNNDHGTSVKQTSDGGYIIAGVYRLMPGDTTDASNVYLIKTDSQGAVDWDIIYSNNNTSDQCWDVIESNAGYVLFSNINQGEEFELFKTDLLGNTVWTKSPVGNYFNEGFCIQQTNDGGYIIAGRGATISAAGLSFIKTDNLGDTIWTKYFNGVEHAWGSYVQQTNDGGYIATGITFSNSGAIYALYLVKTDGNGNITSTFNIPVNPNRKLEKIVDILGRKISPKTNLPFIEIYDDGTVEKRIVIE